MSNEQYLDEKEAQVTTPRCTSCGAEMDFDIESGNLKCAHCGSIQEIEKDDNVQRREMTDEVLKQHANWNESTVAKCSGCGASHVLDKKDISRECCFCGSNTIVATSELAGIKPDSVIPFQITKDSALERFTTWMKKKWLAPRLFKTADVRAKFNGLYCSCWSFSAKTENSYSGTLGRRVSYQVRGANGQMVTRTQIKYFRVSGNINETYLDYLVQSGDRISPAMFSKIKPFNLKLIQVYRQEFLSGIIAEHYSRNLDSCFNDFSTYVRADIRRKILRKHNADTVSTLNIQTKWHDRKFNYILLPVYIANYLYNGKTFNFYVNGASGAIVGKYPKSKLKIALIVLGSILAVGAIGVGLYFGGIFG